MSYADGLKDSEIANEISNSSNNEDTSESESIQEKNTSHRKKVLFRRKGSVSRRAPAEIVSKTGSCKTRKTKETQQDEGEIGEKRIENILEKTNNQHQQSKTISLHFESREINSESTKIDDRKLNVRRKDSLGKTLSDTNSSDNEDTLKYCNRKDNIISRLFNSRIKKSKTRRSNQEHYLKTCRVISSPKTLPDEVENEVTSNLPRKISKEVCCYDQSKSSAMYNCCAVENFRGKNKCCFKGRGSQSIGEITSDGKSSSITVQNIFSGYSEKANDNLNGLKINPTCEKNQTKIDTDAERSLEKEFLHDGSRSAGHSHPKRQSRIVQSNCMFKKVCVSDKIIEYINQSSPSSPIKSNQSSYRISSDQKKGSVSKNLPNTRFLTSSSSSSYSENDPTQKDSIKTNSNTKSSRQKEEVSKNSIGLKTNLTSETNQAKMETYVEKSLENECLYDQSRSSHNSTLVKDSPIKRRRVVQRSCMFKKVCVSDKTREYINQYSPSPRKNNELECKADRISSNPQDADNFDCDRQNESKQLYCEDSFDTSYISEHKISCKDLKQKDSLSCSSGNGKQTNKADGMRKSFSQSFKSSTEKGYKVNHFNLGEISTASEERVKLDGNEVLCNKFNTVPDKPLIDPAVNSSSTTSSNCNSRHLNKQEVSKKQSNTCFLSSSSSSSSSLDSDNDPTPNPSMETNCNTNSRRHLKKHKISKNQSRKRFHARLQSSSSSDSENDSMQKPTTNTNCNDDSNTVTKSKQKVKANCYEALSDLSNGNSGEKSPLSDIYSSKLKLPLSNCLGEKYESIRNKRGSRELSHIFPRNSSLINNFNRKDVAICESNVTITSQHTHFAYSSPDDESSESQEGRNMLFFSDSSGNVVEIEKDNLIENSYMNIVNDNPNKIIVENKNSRNYELVKCLPNVDLDNTSQFSNNSTKTGVLLSDSKNVSTVNNKINPSSRSSGNTNVSAKNTTVTGPNDCKTVQHTYFHYSSSNEDDVSSTEIKNLEYSSQDSSDDETEFGKKFEDSSLVFNLLNSPDKNILSSTSNGLPGRSTRKRKAENDESVATPSKVSCKTSDTVKRTFISSKKAVGNEDNSLPNDLYNQSNIHSPKKNSAKKNLFSPEKKLGEVSIQTTDCRTPTKQKKDDQNDKENRAQSLSKYKNESTPKKVSKEYVSFEKDAETEDQVKYKLTPLKPAQTPTRQINTGSTSQCERGSRTPRNNRGDNMHREESQTSNESSPRKNNFNEISPSKKVTGSASKLKSYGEPDEVGSGTRTPQKESKNSVTERELKRLNIDCNPSFFETPSPVRKRSSVLNATTPQKNKDYDESTVKSPQKGPTKRDIEKINEGRQVKYFNMHQQGSQTSKELSSWKNNFDEILPNKNVTGSASKLKSYGEPDEVGSRTRTPQKESKNSVTERELRRLNIDCNPSFFETPSPVRKRSSVLNATTPQKNKDYDESTVKSPQKGPTKRDIEKINEGRQVKYFNMHQQGSQTSKELSSWKNNFDEISPNKNVTGSASKLKSYGEPDEVGSRTRTPQKESKISVTERELKRLNIDCNPSFFETPSPVRKRPSVLNATTPQKNKDYDESTVKSPQKGPTKRDIEKINEGRQVKCFTPCKNGIKLLSSAKGTPLSPAGKCGKYEQNMMSPLQRKAVTVTTPVSKKKSGRERIPPSMAQKEHVSKGKSDDDLDATRKQLHISTVPKSLPCRDAEFDQIKSFLLRKIEHSAGGCMYISGVPGTGKTATVHAVIRSLQQGAEDGELPEFDFVEVNGLRLTEPKQAYVRILQTLTDRKLTPDQAQQLLNKRFSGECKKSTIILVDELDYLCNRRQDVIYNILDWPTKRGSGLVVLTISNTMDLPERTLKGRVTSRMGLTRVTFQPYSHHQLRTIVEDRLGGTDTFHPDAVQLVARKVAAVSGDARRALDICRRTTELVTHGEQVTVSNVERALTQIFSGPRVTVIQSLCREGQLVLRAIRDINQRTGVDEAMAKQVYQHLLEICLVEGCPRPTVGAMLQTCVALVALGLIVAEKGRVDIMRKMSLNVSSDDIHYALDKVKV